MTDLLARAWAVSLTPFRSDGTIDEGGLRAHLTRLADAGLGVYVAGGGSGEAYTLGDAEIRRVVRVAVDEIGGRVPVGLMGREPRTVEEMLAMLDIAAAEGADLAQVYSVEPGHGAQPSPAEVRRYFERVVAAAPLPVTVSTHFSVGYLVPLELLAELASWPSVVGVHVTVADPTFLVQVHDAVAVPVLVGGPVHALTNLALGGAGYLCSEANLVPSVAARVVRDRASDPASSDRSFATLLRVFQVGMAHGGIRALKAYLRHRGLPGGHVREPRLDLDGPTTARVVAALDTLDLDLG